ncbi:MAG: YceD family protein [Pseudomonadota bacterium]
MSSRLPKLVDPWRLSEQELSYTGVVELADFPRLAGSLVRREGVVSYDLRFFRDRLGRPLVAGNVAATLWLTCQRCLDDVSIPVDSGFRLVVVQGLDEAAALSEEFEPLLVDEASINPRDLLEEELLLSLPVVARHEACHAWQSDDEPNAAESREHPFQVLQKLKH